MRKQKLHRIYTKGSFVLKISTSLICVPMPEKGLTIFELAISSAISDAPRRCYTARALRIMSDMIKCQHCGKMMTEAYVMEQVRKSMIISEGARAMSLRKPHRLTRQHAQTASHARWKPVKMA